MLTTSCRLVRTSLMLTLMCCYLMWGVTYLAQVYPLESKLVPRPCKRLFLHAVQDRGRHWGRRYDCIGLVVLSSSVRADIFRCDYKV